MWEREFSEWCNEKFLVNKKTSPVVLQDYVEKVVAFLKDGVYPPGLDARQKSNFKFKVIFKYYIADSVSFFNISDDKHYLTPSPTQSTVFKPPNFEVLQFFFFCMNPMKGSVVCLI